MSETTDSADNPFTNFFPTKFFSAWTGDNAERVEAFVDQWEKWEEQSADQTEKAVEETAHLIRATLDYSLELQSEFRKQTLENMRKTLEMFSPDDD